MIKKAIKTILNSLPSSHVIVFHHVTNKPEFLKSGCVLSADSFKEIVTSLSNFDSLESTINNYNKHKTAITFDDGLKDLYTIAYPYLTSKGIPFTAFIVPDFLDQPGYISKQELIEMSKNKLVTIGSHGLTHKNFTTMSYEEKEKELVESKKILEDLINKEVNIIAYPHGQFDKETINLVNRYYKYGMAVSTMPVNIITHLFNKKLPRYNIDSNSISRVKKLLNI